MVSEQQILPASTHFPTLIGISVREITKPEKTSKVISRSAKQSFFTNC